MPGIQKTTQTKPTEAWSKQSVLLLSMTSVRSTCRTGWIYRAHPSQQFPPASLCRGYNVITIPLSLKARLYLQERETKESLCKEPKMSYPQHVFHTAVIISFSFALFQEDTEQPAHTRAMEQATTLILLQDPDSHLPVVVVSPRAVSPALRPAWPNPALEEFIPSSRNAVLGHQSCWLALLVPDGPSPGMDNVNLQHYGYQAQSLAAQPLPSELNHLYQLNLTRTTWEITVSVFSGQFPAFQPTKSQEKRLITLWDRR